MPLFNTTIVNVTRALAELRASRPVVLVSGRKAVLVVAAESWKTGDAVEYERLTHSPAHVLLTADRQRVLGLEPHGKPGIVAVADAERAGVLQGLYDPHTSVPKGRALPKIQPAPAYLAAALDLAKHAELLPAVMVAEIRIRKDTDVERWAERHGLLTVKAANVARYPALVPETVEEVVDARVPLHGIGDVRLKVFRPADGGYEHLAIIVGDWKPSGQPPAVRVHSSCLTGDVLGSMRCDCGEQLRRALAVIKAEGGGVLLYINQEGRGIGLANKLRAYCLQDQGMDTVEANQALGFNNDERAFGLAAALLRRLGIASIRLLTNNPRKMAELEAEGITVAGRIAIKIDPNGVNDSYLQTKASKAGHLL